MQTAIVTGGGGSLGTGIAKCLKADGWRVIVADIRGEAAARTTADLGPPAEAMTVDVSDRAAAGAMMDNVVARFGSIEGLVNCAGGTSGSGLPNVPFMETDPAFRDRLMAANLYGIFNCCHAVLPHMMRAKAGAIVNISSGAGIPGGPAVTARRRNAVVYSAIKGGVIAFGQSLALEVGPHGIRVNAIAPGRAVSTTHDLEAIRAKQKQEEALQPGSSRQSPLGRLLQPEDIGDAAAFLLSKRAEHITGCLYDLTGGLRLY
jgi:NAD(P)-dependent dehydrogenase (short-subunit alcohol dehydrogenase family)